MDLTEKAVEHGIREGWIVFTTTVDLANVPGRAYRYKHGWILINPLAKGTVGRGHGKPTPVGSTSRTKKGSVISHSPATAGSMSTVHRGPGGKAKTPEKGGGSAAEKAAASTRSKIRAANPKSKPGLDRSTVGQGRGKPRPDGIGGQLTLKSTTSQAKGSQSVVRDGKNSGVSKEMKSLRGKLNREHGPAAKKAAAPRPERPARPIKPGPKEGHVADTPQTIVSLERFRFNPGLPEDRYHGSTPIAELESRGLVRKSGSGYKITAKGKRILDSNNPSHDAHTAEYDERGKVVNREVAAEAKRRKGKA